MNSDSESGAHSEGALLPDPAAAGRQLARLRKRLRLSQGALAQRAGVSESYVRAFEQGKMRNPRPLTLQLLANGLELAEWADVMSERADQVGVSGPRLRIPSPAGVANLVGENERERLALARRLIEMANELLHPTGQKDGHPNHQTSAVAAGLLVPAVGPPAFATG